MASNSLGRRHPVPCGRYSTPVVRRRRLGKRCAVLVSFSLYWVDEELPGRNPAWCPSSAATGGESVDRTRLGQLNPLLAESERRGPMRHASMVLLASESYTSPNRSA